MESGLFRYTLYGWFFLGVWGMLMGVGVVRVMDRIWNIGGGEELLVGVGMGLRWELGKM